MLARTADNLYWLARYVERADYVARIVGVTRRLASLPAAKGAPRLEWDSALAAAGVDAAYLARHGQTCADTAIDYLVFDPENASSIVSCVEFGRTNARAVRTALTAETWDVINSGWLEFQQLRRARAARPDDHDNLARALELASKLSFDVDGSSYRSMLRNDAYWFGRVGLYIERADNTARILDVKYNILLPETEVVGGSLDYFQWTAILRSVSALTAYNWIYRDTVRPSLVTELLILRPEMPRSLISCYDNVARYLEAIAAAYKTTGPSQAHAHDMLAKLRSTSVSDVFHVGLHEFLTTFIENNSQLGQKMTDQYLVE